MRGLAVAGDARRALFLRASRPASDSDGRASLRRADPSTFELHAISGCCRGSELFGDTLGDRAERARRRRFADRRRRSARP